MLVRLVVLAAVASVAAASASAAPVAPCRAAQLAGDFSVLAGSGAAGHISYVLHLRNTSSSICFVSGQPGFQLLGKTGSTLPTRVQPLRPGLGTAVRIVLKPGASAWSTARFSPDVPGPGEPANRACEPTAYKVRVKAPPGPGAVVVAVSPPTPVCEHGSLLVSLLQTKRPTG